MLVIRNDQINHMILADKNKLTLDILEYLREYCPEIASLYPDGHFVWLIKDSIEIASDFNINDVYLMRVFVRLRWEIAPGFFKQHEINKVLLQVEESAQRRFDLLSTERFAPIWEEACHFDHSSEWRRNF